VNDSASSLPEVKDLPSDAPHGAADRKVRAGLLFALICLVIAGALFSLSVQRLRSNAAWVEHTHPVLAHLDRLVALVTDAGDNFVRTAREPIQADELLGLLAGMREVSWVSGLSRPAAAMGVDDR
jgi:hypothetical protein